MHRLAEIIVEKIRDLQEEMDNEFLLQAQKLNQGWEVTAIKPQTDDPLGEELEVLLKALHLSLEEAIAAEDYGLAAKIQKEIENLKKR